ncbi:hypothetical protein HNR49_002399 [Halobacterium salinarum]|uniref:Uncharacterized protein n=1 Tax=Halobacterium salinarum TaxID=2242 RepID=A0A841HF02_HALSI|nr:hypothetical protein [Halobacterium salinarum]
MKMHASHILLTGKFFEVLLRGRKHHLGLLDRVIVLAQFEYSACI